VPNFREMPQEAKDLPFTLKEKTKTARTGETMVSPRKTGFLLELLGKQRIRVIISRKQVENHSRRRSEFSVVEDPEHAYLG
jgi:hypothetical protein